MYCFKFNGTHYLYSQLEAFLQFFTLQYISFHFIDFAHSKDP